MPSWTFSALGFAVLWRATGRDVLPYPIQFRSTADTTDDYENQWKAEAGELARRVDEDVEAAMRILGGPEVRVEISGFAGAAPGSGDLLQMGDPRRRVRVLAAVHHRQAVLVVQEPTADPESGGSVRISLTRSDNIARHLLAVLSDAPRGTSNTVRVNRTDLTNDDRPFTAFTNDSPRTGVEQARRFFNRPRTTIAYVAVCPGPATDRRPTPARDFHIVDYPDGRYLVRHNDSTLRADPADQKTLESHLHSTLTATITAHREDTNTTYV